MQLEHVPDDQYDDLAWIMMQESGGEVDKRNKPVKPRNGGKPRKPTSARGLFQLLKGNYHFNPNGEKSFGNAVEEAQGGIRYIMKKYGSAKTARAFWEQWGKF